MKDSFPLKLLLRPALAFEALRTGEAGWGWPLALFALGAASSAALLALAPADFLAEAGSALPSDGGFAGFLAAGLAGGALFSVLSCALLAAFAGLLAEGRLMLRVPLPAAGVAAYAFFFVARRNAGQAGPAAWAAAAAAVALAARAALRDRAGFAALLKAFLALSLFTLLADAWGAAAALAGAPRAYAAGEYFFSFLSLVWLVRAAAALRGVSAPRAFAAAVPALLGAAAFAFSLTVLGLLPADLFRAALLM